MTPGRRARHGLAARGETHSAAERRSVALGGRRRFAHVSPTTQPHGHHTATRAGSPRTAGVGIDRLEPEGRKIVAGTPPHQAAVPPLGSGPHDGSTAPLPRRTLASWTRANYLPGPDLTGGPFDGKPAVGVSSPTASCRPTQGCMEWIYPPSSSPPDPPRSPHRRRPTAVPTRDSSKSRPRLRCPLVADWIGAGKGGAIGPCSPIATVETRPPR